ncbi:MAG: hypothetical protein LIO91_01990 [Bacteroidales bacterium]|nr:hypothetical protein [Bacteroidales bacterium]
MISLRPHLPYKAYKAYKPHKLLGILGGILLLESCSQGEKAVNIPRPEAWPRVDLYTEKMDTVEGLPLLFEANTDALATTSREDAGWWVNVRYPQYRATLYISMTPVDAATEQKVIDNRVERISRNIGGRTTEMTELTTPSGFHASVTMTRTASVTPVQFIATLPQMWVVSGSLALDKAPSSPDSIAPVIEAVQGDVIRMLQHLKPL